MDSKKTLLQSLSSVKVRVLLFLCFMSALFGFSNIYSIYHGVRCEQQFSEVLNKYHSINRFMTVFSDSPVFFEEYMNEKLEENWMRFINNELQVQKALQEMIMEADDMSLDGFLLMQSIKNTYMNYSAISREGFPANQEIRQLILIKQAAAQISDYTAQLLQDSLTYGTDVYQNMQANMNQEHQISLFLMVVVFSVSALCAVYMKQRVLDPLNQLAETVGEITRENFDVPDLPTDRSDEIGHLNQALNRMKQTMRDIIAALKEKQILTQQLHTQELTLMNRQKMLEKARFSLLQSQINPHFLFNTLNVIAGAAANEHARETGELIRSLSDFFRYTLESKGETVCLTQELQMVGKFMYIQRKRFGKRLRYRLKVDVEPQKYRLPPFTLQPLIENGIRHGVLIKEKGGTVGINIREADDDLVIFVLDSGVGMDKKQTADLISYSLNGENPNAKGSTGMGTANVFERLRMVFPSSRIHIFSKPGMGTCIKIKIALEECKNA